MLLLKRHIVPHVYIIDATTYTHLYVGTSANGIACAEYLLLR